MYVTIKEAIIINVFILDNEMIRDFYSIYTSKERQTSIKYNSLFTKITAIFYIYEISDIYFIVNTRYYGKMYNETT